MRFLYRNGFILETCHISGIHLEKDMSVPFGHTVVRNVCLFEILCAPKSVECAFFEIVRAPNRECRETTYYEGRGR